MTAKRVILTSGTSWTVASDWNSANNTVECIGGGQSGCVGTTSALGGGYAKIANLALTAGANITVHIGTGGASSTTSTRNNGGDTWFDSTSTVLATGGGSGTAAVGSTTFAGGGGVTARGGGGAAGPGGNGGNPATLVGGTGGGGSGGAGGASASPGSPGAEWTTAGSGGGGGGNATTGAAAGAGGNYGGGGGSAATSGTGGAGAAGVIVLTYTPAATGSETFQVNETLRAATLAGALTDARKLTLAATLAPSTLAGNLSKVETLALGATLAPATLYSLAQSAGAPPPPSFQANTISSSVEIYNRALSRIGIDQYLGDPNETSKAGTLYRMWYDACRQTCLRDFPWNFASAILPLAPLANITVPGWTYVYAYPVDCLQARQVCDAGGARTTLNDVLGGQGFSFPYSELYQGGYPNIAMPKVPFKVLSVGTSTGGVQRVLVTDMPNAYLVYTLDITDTGQFDAGFVDALEWLIGSEVAGPFLGAPAGQQVAEACGKYYRNNVLNARAQNLNEATPDIRPDSPAVAARA